MVVLFLENPTPYYINFGSLTVNGQKRLRHSRFCEAPKVPFQFDEKDAKKHKKENSHGVLLMITVALTKEYEVLIKWFMV